MRVPNRGGCMLRRVVLLLLGVLVVNSTLAVAQQGTADLRGRVIDQQGAVLPGVTVVVRHQESGLFRESVSSTDGTFLLSGMTPGMYEVTAEMASFKKYSQRDVRLEVGRTTQVELKLEVGGLTEAVTVTSEAPLVDTSTQEIGGRISQQEFVDTPSFNRNFAGYLRSEEHTSELQSQSNLVCRLLLEKKKKQQEITPTSQNSTLRT